MNLPSSNPFLGYFTFAAQGNTVKVDVGLEEEAANTFVLQEAAAKAER